MAITDKKISEVYSGRDISSLSDRPNQDGMTAAQLKAKFDQLIKELMPKYNDLIDELNDTTLPGKIDQNGLNSNIDVLSFFTETIVPFTRAGQLRWNEVLKTLELKISDDVTLQIGRETLLEARNDGTTLIQNGQAVYVSGGAVTNAYIKRASTADVDIAQYTIGVATEPMQPGEYGNTCTEGIVNGINTNAWEEGDKLYLGVDGALTNVEPVSPTPKVFMGVVLKKHLSLGSIYVKVRAIPRMAKLSDVFVSSIADGHALIWNGTTGRFENEAIYNKTEVDALANARYTKTEMQTSGSALMHWDNLTNKPNFADDHWKTPVANRGALPLTGNTLGDNRVVLDDGDGKQAVYTCIALTGDVDAQWSKVADVDWMSEEQTRITQELARVSAEEDRVDAEGLRVGAESDRVTAENTRVSQESTRQSQESTRQSQESTRQSQESARVSAENTRVSNENTRIASENARNVFVAYDNGTAYVVGNKVSYLGSSYVCILDSTGNLPTNTTYWLLIAQKGDNTNASDVTNTPSGNISATNVQTAINELDTEKAPTVHTHDDRYYTETEVNTLLNTKADKTQEAWITATLLNGTTGVLKYRKTYFNQLEIYADIYIGTGANNTKIFQLPSGYYIPSYMTIVTAYNATQGTVQTFRINITGEFVTLGSFTNGNRLMFSVTMPLQ